eukprot:Amastigsp_a4408_37.p2 type:complete len:112 gc:universal Amastigsp_a4408_37:1206-1541(+)
MYRSRLAELLVRVEAVHGRGQLHTRAPRIYLRPAGERARAALRRPCAWIRGAGLGRGPLSSRKCTPTTPTSRTPTRLGAASCTCASRSVVRGTSRACLRAPEHGSLMTSIS